MQDSSESTVAESTLTVPKGGKGGKGPPSPVKGGKGKAPPPPPSGSGKGSKAKGASKSEEVPEWQKPKLSEDWQADRVVNWQPIRQTSRLQGSVWQQVQESLDGGASKLPDGLLKRFMQKKSEVQEKRPSGSEEKKSSRRRLLSSQQGLVADIHHALLLRKGIQSPRQLCWVAGSSKEAAEAGEDGSAAAELSEELLEALLGLLGAAAGEERGLVASSAGENSAPSEAFLRRLLRECSLAELQARVQLALHMASFSARAADLERGLSLALSAVWAVIDSKALPLLLEGILLLGNSVNAGSKNLGGAVGVTLESLTKLAHTRCLPAKKVSSKRDESALEVLVQHLEQANRGFMQDLSTDLDACQAARDFDQKAVQSSVQEQAKQIQKLEQRMLAASSSGQKTEAPAALSATRLQHFLEEAKPKTAELEQLLVELEEATSGLRQWFAEPPSSSLTGMLKILAALRDSLPIPKPAASDVNPRPYYLSSTRASRRLSTKSASDGDASPEKVQDEQTSREATAEEAEKTEAADAPAVPASAGSDSESTTSEPCSEKQQPEDAPLSLQLGAACHVQPPSGVLAQILSFSNGALWISWLFDWGDVVRGFSQTKAPIQAFEVMQFAESKNEVHVAQKEMDISSATSRWLCRNAPFKANVPIGRHYTFGVRAVLLPHCADEHILDMRLADMHLEPLWASGVSSPVVVDLRCSAASSRAAPASGQGASALESKAQPARASGGRGRVASSLGDFIRTLQAPATTSSAALQPPSTAVKGHLADDQAHLAAREEAIRTKPKMDAEEAKEAASPLPAESRHSRSSEDVVSPLPAKSSNSWFDAEDTPSSLPAKSQHSWGSDASDVSLSEFDDESLRNLAQALRFLEGGSYSPDRRSSDAPSQLSSPEKQDADESPVGCRRESTPGRGISTASEPKGSISVPRAASIFDDDTVQSMARALSTVEDMQLYGANQRVDAGDVQSGTPLPSEVASPSMVDIPLPGPDGLLDGNEVLAAAERAYKSRMSCKDCHGSGYVGLFGSKGMGIFSKPCTSCQARQPL